MIFNSSSDIKEDISTKVSNYIGEVVSQNMDIDTKNIISLLRSYLHELEIRDEIKQYHIEDRNNILYLQFQKENELIEFKIDLYSELRKLKIIRIQSHNNELSKFFIT